MKLKAEEKLGVMLKEQEKNVGGRPTENPLHDESGFPTLSDQGISHTQSHRWQKVADVTEERFQAFILLNKHLECRNRNLENDLQNK